MMLWMLHGHYMRLGVGNHIDVLTCCKLVLCATSSEQCPNLIRFILYGVLCLEGELPHVGQSLIVLAKPTVDDNTVVAALSLDDIGIKPATRIGNTIAAIRM